MVKRKDAKTWSTDAKKFFRNATLLNMKTRREKEKKFFTQFGIKIFAARENDEIMSDSLHLQQRHSRSTEYVNTGHQLCVGVVMSEGVTFLQMTTILLFHSFFLTSSASPSLQKRDSVRLSAL